MALKFELPNLIGNAGKVLTVDATEENVLWGIGGGGTILTISDNFETVSKNLKSYPYVLNYTGTKLTSIVYNIGVGIITKTFNYIGTQLMSITLSGNTPDAIDLNKTLVYVGTTLSQVTYS